MYSNELCLVTGQRTEHIKRCEQLRHRDLVYIAHFIDAFLYRRGSLDYSITLQQLSLNQVDLVVITGASVFSSNDSAVRVF